MRTMGSVLYTRVDCYTYDMRVRLRTEPCEIRYRVFLAGESNKHHLFPWNGNRRRLAVR